MRSGALLAWGAGLAACVALGVLCFASDPAGEEPRTSPQAAVTPAADAPDVTLHLDGEAVVRLAAADLVGRPAVVDLLPVRARDPAGWTVVRAFGVRRSQFALEEPTKHLAQRDLRLYLQEDGMPAVGLFRRPREGMTPEALATLAQPGLFLPRVTDVHVWTVEEPRRAEGEQGPVLLVTVEGADTQERIPAARLDTLPVATADAGAGHEGHRVLDVVGLVVDAARVERVRIVGGGGEPLLLTREQLRAPGVAALLRVNKRGLWAFDMAGRLPSGAPQTGRRRGVTRLVVGLGEAEALPERPVASGRPVNIHRTKPSAEEQARIDALLELSRKAPDAEARAAVMAGLGDPSPQVRLRAVRSLRAWEDAVPDLWDHLQREEDVEIQRACVRTVGDRGEAAYIEQLRDWAEGRSKRVRKDVGKAMRRIAKREGLPEPERLIPRRR